MRFTPYNIKTQEFNRAVRGYDKDEVQAFLEAVSVEFEKLIKDNEELLNQVEEYKQDIKEYKHLEKSLQSTLVEAQESSSKALASAKRQNELIIKEAEVKAAQVIAKANKESERIINAVHDLREEKKLLLAKLKSFVDTQVKILDRESTIIESAHEDVKEETRKEDDLSLDVDDIVEKLL
jgi:cell division initiation protein